MIQSMTAFARTAVQNHWGAAVWEIRSVNHRYLEITVRLPESLRELEPNIRERIRKKIQRGKLEIFLKYSPQINDQEAFNLNTKTIKQLANVTTKIKKLFPKVGLPTIIDILQWPGVMSTEINSEEINAVLLTGFDLTLADLLKTRQSEGNAIEQMIRKRLQQILELVNKIKMRLPEIMENQRQKLLTRVAEVNVTLDPERLEQEMVLLAQKTDISEELDRLEMHAQEIQKSLQQTTAVGRRLDFLIQELHREANTLAAKSIDAETSTIAVELRVLIEQLREQVQNVE